MSSNEIQKPLLDERDYRYIVLDNELSVLLVHDQICDKAAAALDVNVGYFSDPETIPGLAHFLEHMLFMGTEKYPKENEYSEYLSKHGGHSNAYTTTTNTNYYFDVAYSHLEGALDRFAQFFILPLFSSDGVEREMNAVDSEFKKNLQIDSRRLHQIMKVVANVEHPFSKFDIGNLATLKEEPMQKGIAVLEKLFEFHRTYYSANLMKLVVCGRESLDTLEVWVREKFSAVVNKKVPVPSFSGHPYEQNQLGKEVIIRPVKELRRLKIVFSLPSIHRHWRIKPISYISHLVGHESEGSILALLKQKGWATSLYAGPSELSTDFELFTVTVDLTKEGMLRYLDVVVIVFQYLKVIKEAGAQQWIYDEAKKLSDIGFMFKEKTSPSSFASSTSSSMQFYPPEYVLKGPHTFEQYDPQLIEDSLNYLRLESMMWFVICPEADMTMFTDIQWLREPRYNIQYTVRPLPGIAIDCLSHLEKNTALHLPLKNEFIPENFDVLKERLDKPQIPKLISETKFSRVWYKKDDTFLVPKANICLLLRTPLAYQTPYTSALTKLYTDLVKDRLAEYAYMAECSGLHYTLDIVVEGIVLVFSGYNDKLLVFIEKVLEIMRSLQVDALRLAVSREKLERSYLNYYKEAPHQHASFYASYVLQQYLWTPAEKLQALKTFSDINTSVIESFTHDLFGQLFMELFIHGNLTKVQAQNISNRISFILAENGSRTRALPLPLRFATGRYHILPQATSVTFLRETLDPSNPNSAIEYYLQVSAQEDAHQQSLLHLVSHLLQDPAFNQLRTQEQLGYIVWTTYRRSSGVMGLRMIIQSERAPAYLEERIELFLTKYKTELEQLGAEEFEKQVQSIITIITQRDQNLNQETTRWWRHIQSGTYDFNQVEKITSILRGLTHQEVLQFYDTYILPSSQTRSKLTIHVQSQAKNGNGQPRMHLQQIQKRLWTWKGIRASLDEIEAAVGLECTSPLESSKPVEESIADEYDVEEVTEKVLTTLLVRDPHRGTEAETAKVVHMFNAEMKHSNESTMVFVSEKEVQEWKRQLLLAPAPTPVDPLVLMTSKN